MKGFLKWYYGSKRRTEPMTETIKRFNRLCSGYKSIHYQTIRLSFGSPDLISANRMKTKTKTSTTYKENGNYPHVSQKSNKISKAPCSMSVIIEKENIPISSQTSLNDSCKKEESSKDHDNKEDMRQTCLPFNGCRDTTVVRDCFASFPPSCSEQVTWAPTLDAITVPKSSESYNSLLDLAFADSEENILFPTLEEPMGEEEDHYGGFPEISDSSWFNLMHHQANPFPDEFVAKSRLLDLDRIAYFDQETTWLVNSLFLPPLVSQETSKRKNLTLVLDLDETLVHSSLEKCYGGDFTFQMTILEKEYTVYVGKRPFLQEFLEKVSEMFEIIIFTAAKSEYAEKVLDGLDPHNKFFTRRLYQDSCTWVDSHFVKDLTILGIDMAKVFIIDNTPEVFRFQVNNGIPIKSWYEDPTDSALISLLPFLEKLVDVEDVRPFIADKFGTKN
ncbi:CTD small phosphatase-like protein 2, partial [Mucuna pruriens]